MVSIQTKTQMVGAAVAVMLAALVAMLVHVQINYEADMRDVVRLRAAIATCVVSFPLALLVMYQVFRTQQLSIELQRLLNRDRLTDIATRDFFFARMADEPDAYGVTLMIDIDHFKQVNDGYGHLAGDAVIANVAEVLRSQMRETDIVCRFGGEEFVVFLHEASRDLAWAIAERLRTEIALVETRLACDAVKVTVSIGGSIKAPLDQIDEAIQRADECLYRAKSLGRNRTEVDWHAASTGSGNRDAFTPEFSFDHVRPDLTLRR